MVVINHRNLPFTSIGLDALQLAVAREQLAQRNQELDEKDEELAALRVKLQKMEARNSNPDQQNGTAPDPVHLQPTRVKS